MANQTINAGNVNGPVQAEKIGTLVQNFPGGKPCGPPRQIPPRPDHFTGREEKIAGVIESLRLGHVVTLWGPGGIGKSAIASEVLWRITGDGKQFPEAFPDGVIWHDFYRTKETAKALEAIALAFGEEPIPTPLGAAKRALSGKRVLLLLDGAEDADHLPLVLEAAGTCGVIVTTRKKEGTSDRREVETLPDADAAGLLRAWAGEMADDPDAVRRICGLVGNLPLALRIAGAYMGEETEPAAEYLEWLEETSLEALDFGERKSQSVAVLLQRSLDQVGDRAREILSIVGMMAFGPFGEESVAAALDAKPRELKKPFRELTGYGLLLRPDDRYALSHALIHTYVRENHPPGVGVVERIMDFYADFAEKESEKGPVGYAILNPERAHILSLLGACAGEKACLPEACRGPGIWERVRKLVWAVEDFLDICGYWMDRVSVLEVGIVGAERSGNRYDEGAFLGNLGSAYSNLGQTEKAIEYHEQALAIAREIGYRMGEGNHTGNLGLAYYSLGQTEKAIGFYEQALAISREIGNKSAVGSILGNLGIDYKNLGQVGKAIECHKQALAISREIGDRRGERSDLGNLGIAYSNLGQTEKSIEYHEQALAIAREIGDRRGEGSSLGNLGNAYRNLGQTEKAIGFYEQALVISREIENKSAVGSILGNLGSAYSDLGQTEKAIEYHEQALAISREIGDRWGEGISLGNKGSAYSALGQTEKAIGFYEQALVISREIGDRRGEGKRLGNLGIAYRNLGQTEKAIEYHEQALTISREIGDRMGEGSDLGNLGNAYSNLGQTEKAIGFYEQALAISREIGDRQNEGNQLGNLGNAYSDLGQTEKAIEYHKQALTIAREIGDRRGEGNHTGNLGNAYSNLGQYAKAIEYHEQALVISREIGDRRGEGNHTGNLGNAYSNLGQTEKAIGFYEQALTISREIGDRRGEGNSLGNLGIAYRNLGQTEKAIGFYEQALAIAREIGDRRGEGSQLGNLGLAYSNLGQTEKAIELMEQSIAILEEIKSPHANKFRKNLERIKSTKFPVYISPPRPFDIKSAVEKNIQYQAALAAWKKLPWLKRIRTKKPKKA